MTLFNLTDSISNCRTTNTVFHLQDWSLFWRHLLSETFCVSVTCAVFFRIQELVQFVASYSWWVSFSRSLHFLHMSWWSSKIKMMFNFIPSIVFNLVCVQLTDHDIRQNKQDRKLLSDFVAIWPIAGYNDRELFRYGCLLLLADKIIYFSSLFISQSLAFIHYCFYMK